MAKRLTHEEFVNCVKEKHGDKYDLSSSVFVGVSKPIHAICNIHGEFTTAARNLLYGVGCPLCAKESPNRHTSKQKSRKKILGFGVLDIDFSYNKNKLSRKAYEIWCAMIRRVKTRKEYFDCTICDEWKYFSNFLTWFKKNYVKGYHLDKDILVKGNRVYSPETCCFVPPEINSLITNRRNYRNGIIGTCKLANGKYYSSVNKKEDK